jgi:ferritin-like metal-binding protein YciE
MARSERSGHTTTDHDFIRRWVEERGGWPARVVGTSRGDDDAGLIRIDFPGFSGEGSLERIEWEEWFQGFEDNQLAFLHRDLDHGGGDLDRFNKLISRSGDEGGEEEDEGGRGGGSSARGRGASGGRSGSARKAGTSEGKASSGRGGAARKAESGGGGRGGASATADTGDKGNGKASSGRSGSSRKAGAAEGETSSGRGGSARKAEGAGNGRRGAASSAAETGAKSTGARGGAKAGSRAGGAEGPGNNSELRALLLHGLGDLLSAERLFLASTRTLAREAQDPEVRARVEQHVGETEGQIERLREAFGALGERQRAVTCEAARGLKEEHDSFKSEEKPSKQLLSAYGLGSGLRVEHYEIAAYRSAIELATALGERECAGILNESLKEELAMASFLEKNSRAVLKRMASGGGGGGGAEGGASSRGGSSARASGGTGSSSGKKSAESGSSAAKKSTGSGSSSGKKSGGSSGGGARGGARA